MERVGFLGRIMLILMAALLAAIGATLGLDHLAHESARRRAPAPFPRVVHAAGIIALVRGADAPARRKIVRAANDNLVRVRIFEAPPPRGPGDIRAPQLERRLRDMIGATASDVDAYTDPRMARPHPGPSAIEGRLTKAVAPIGDGRTVVIDWMDPPSIVSLKLLGLPPSAWAGILGFGVAALALLTAFREVRPLRHLTAAVTTFDGTAPSADIEKRGAPDIRRLVRAVHGMQERVVGLLRERSFLIGAISHDLNTYLTRLRLRTETVADDESRERMVGDLDAMTRLIDTSLAFARGITTSADRRRIDLGDLVAVEVEEHNALSPRLALEGAYVNDAIVQGDPLALRRVVCNILDNALKFGRSKVSVEVDRTATHERVVIADDGPGILDEDRRAVFEPFYRVDRSRSRSTGGSGLGLAIARQIVEAHGGTIDIAAAQPTGTSFIIALPSCRSEPARQPLATKRHARSTI